MGLFESRIYSRAFSSSLHTEKEYIAQFSIGGLEPVLEIIKKASKNLLNVKKDFAKVVSLLIILRLTNLFVVIVKNIFLIKNILI